MFMTHYNNIDSSHIRTGGVQSILHKYVEIQQDAIYELASRLHLPSQCSWLIYCSSSQSGQVRVEKLLTHVQRRGPYQNVEIPTEALLKQKSEIEVALHYFQRLI